MSVISRSIWPTNSTSSGRPKEGKLYIEPYEYFDRDVMFICTTDTLFKLAKGKTDPVLAFTTGKLKVEGNIDKALKLGDLLARKRKG